MTAQTIAEKIISQHAGKSVRAGDIVIVPVDGTMATDATGPFAIRAFEQMGGDSISNPERHSLILDHAAPAPNERIANLHRLIRQFSTKHQLNFYDVGAGICHQLMVENSHVKPGDIFLGADSHTPTYGALGAFAIGVGSTDLAAVWHTGKTWLKVPASIKIELDGTLAPFVSAKDIILHLVSTVGVSGATYEAVEFCGPAVEQMTLASRMVLANMVAEMGAKAGLVDTTGLAEWPNAGIHADPSATYRTTYQLDVTNLRPQIAKPHSPGNIAPIDDALGQPIQMAFIGSCTNSRLEDLHAAAAILKGNKVHSHSRLLIAPASKQTLQMAIEDGTLAILTAAGASFITSGCGPCVGTHNGVPGDGEAVISTANRNFKGRMGNPNANIYLGSPAVVAAAAVAGEIIDPADIANE